MDVNYRNHNNQTRLRVGAVKSILLVVVDIEDGSPTGPLVPGHVPEVSVVVLSVCSSDSRQS